MISSFVNGRREFVATNVLAACGKSLWTVDSLEVQTNVTSSPQYRGADKSLARPTLRCILFDSENISFDASLVIYINSINIPPIIIINRLYEHQNLLSL